MTTPTEFQVNFAGEGSQVGVQAGTAYIDTVTLPGGDVQLTVGQDASPEVKYRVGVENLKSGNARRARELIWDAMMHNHGGNEVLFHWLVAMLSGRTVRQFSNEEIDQLKFSRSRCAETVDDAWADGVRLIYRLLDSVLSSAATQPTAAMTDMPLLVRQFENLAQQQRDMVLPHLELFLTGTMKEGMWRRELRLAQHRQHADDRLRHAWMFFQPIPAKVLLRSPQPESVSAVHRFGMRVSALLLVAAVAYLGWELLWHSAFTGLLSYLAALAGGAVAARTDLEWRFLTERRRQKDDRFGAAEQSAPSLPGDEVADRVDKLFNRYFVKYAPDKAERQRWEAAVAGIRRFHRDEIIAICRNRSIPVNELAWLIRFEVCELKRRWQDDALHEYRRLLPRPGTVTARLTGLIFLALGGLWVVVAMRAHWLADVVALLSAFCAWRCWLRVSLERRRYAADIEEHAKRQAAIDEEFSRWSERLKARPKDEHMAAWLGCDRTVLLGKALEHFQLPRNRLNAHAFLEEPGVGVKRARIEGGPWRYARYKLLMFLLAEDGVRQVRANLDFMTGTLSVRERRSYRYEDIVSVRVLQETRRQTFELRLKAGEPIVVRVRDADPSHALHDQNAETPEDVQEAAEGEEDAALDTSSAADLLHLLERVVGDKRNWFQGHAWTGTWADDDDRAAGERLRGEDVRCGDSDCVCRQGGDGLPGADGIAKTVGVGETLVGLGAQLMHEAPAVDPAGPFRLAREDGPGRAALTGEHDSVNLALAALPPPGTHRHHARAKLPEVRYAPQMVAERCLERGAHVIVEVTDDRVEYGPAKAAVDLPPVVRQDTEVESEELVGDPVDLALAASRVLGDRDEPFHQAHPDQAVQRAARFGLDRVLDLLVAGPAGGQRVEDRGGPVPLLDLGAEYPLAFGQQQGAGTAGQRSQVLLHASVLPPPRQVLRHSTDDPVDKRAVRGCQVRQHGSGLMRPERVQQQGLVEPAVQGLSIVLNRLHHPDRRSADQDPQLRSAA